jgi:DNA polymerase/3'-5' exonuclease PolX
MCNREIARQLVDYAHFLEVRGENLFRIRAYRIAAETVVGLSTEIDDLYMEHGIKGLRILPGL